jgi:uncharacterized repeat protein (TIGR03803 family)
MKRNRGSASLMRILLITIGTLAAASSGLAQSGYKSLHRFTPGKDGEFPTAGLVFDQDGNLYGTTALGGANQSGGVVFELAPKAGGGWTETVLYSFCSLANCTDGKYPNSLLFDSAGNLYGSTFFGGSDKGYFCYDGCGVVFKLAPSHDGPWTETVLYTFCSEGGNCNQTNPAGGLTFDKAGNLYGTADGGGSSGNGGVVFKLTPNSDGNWKESVLYTFCSQSNCTDGLDPQSGVIFDAAGNIYGTTAAGGDANCNTDGAQLGCGLVFRLEPHADDNWTENVLHRFNHANGYIPVSSLALDAAGNLYGVTAYGGGSPCFFGQGCGVVYRLMANADGSWTETLLHRFTGRGDGRLPVGGLTLDSSGDLYGTASQGGILNLCSGVGCGVIFKLAPNSKGGWSDTVLHPFFDHPGASPAFTLIFGTAGKLYGTTTGDPNATFGSMFEIMP